MTPTGRAVQSDNGRTLLLLRAKGRSAVGLGACWALARRLARQATRRSRRWCPGGIIVCLSLAHSVATMMAAEQTTVSWRHCRPSLARSVATTVTTAAAWTTARDDSEETDDGVLAELLSASRSLGDDYGSSVDDCARSKRCERRVRL